jgi:hypothetical protein
MHSKSTIVLFVLMSTFAMGQNGIKGTYNWPEYEAVVIPDSLSDESAIYISNVVNIDFSDAAKTTVRVFKRVYINSDEAAEKFSKREFVIEDDGKIGMLQARTVKSSGEILILKDKDVIESYDKSTNKYGGGSISKTQIVYPNVEVGDVIDLAYEINYKRYILSKIMRLEDDLISLYSRITLRNFSMLELTVYSLNEMPEMSSKTVDNIRTVSFEKRGVAVITGGVFDAPKPGSPHFIYTLWYQHRELDYETIYEFDANDYPYNYRKVKSLQRDLILDDVINVNDSRLISVKKFIQYLEKEFEWKSNGELPNTTVQATSGYYDQKIINELLYYRYLLEFLNDSKIPFKKGFTKSLRDGQFIHGAVLLEQLAERFFVIDDENGQAHYLFPPYGKGRYYFLDEIPFQVEGNDCVGLEGFQDKFDSDYALSLPDSEVDFNQHRAMINIEIKSDSCLVSRRDKLRGHYSFLTRSEESAGPWLEELKITDTSDVSPLSVDEIFPYQVVFEQDNLSFDLLSKIDDSLSWLSLASLIPDGIFLEGELDYEYDGYVLLPFVKKSNISFFIKSNNGISIEELNPEIDFENEVGKINMKLVSVNENLIKATLEVVVSQKYLSGELVENYKSLIRSYSDMISKKWVVKVGSH